MREIQVAYDGISPLSLLLNAISIVIFMNTQMCKLFPSTPLILPNPGAQCWINPNLSELTSQGKVVKLWIRLTFRDI